MKIYSVILMFLAAVTDMSAQSTNTLSSGLNDNEVNIVRDGDFAEEAGGVIKMVPKNKKEQVMMVVTDSLDGKPVGTPTNSVVTKDSTIRFKDAATRPVKTKAKNSSPAKTPKPKTK